MTAITKQSKPTFFRDLFDRRFPQIIFIYFGVCWTILEFVSWIVEHYTISPSLTDLSFITLVSMVPTVGMLAYFHGRPGRDEWTKTEKIGIPINVIITGCLLVYFFGGRELGSATTEINIKNEAGQTIRRQIPKSELMKRLAIFFFENESENTDLDWLQYAFMAGCHYDLNQDPIFSVYSGYDNAIYQKITSAGFAENLGMPMVLEQKIAREIEREYFLGGSFTTKNDSLVVKTYLYETNHGKLLYEHEFSGTNVFRIMDQINDQLKKDLDVPVWHREDIQDLPVAEMTTSSEEAFRQYIIGSNLTNLKNDPVAARPHLESAVQLDPTFALAHYGLYQLYINLNLFDNAVLALNTAMQYIYKFPESIQFAIKEEYYLISEDPEKRTAIIDMWVKLYPDDIRGHFRLAEEYFKQFKIDDAIAEYNKILTIDPARQYYLRYIGNAYLLKGDFKNALSYFEQYHRAFPKDYRSFVSFGDLFLIMGDYDKARDYYTDAQILEPNEISITIMLARINLLTGNYTTALTQLHNAENMADTPMEKQLVYSVFYEYYRQRGEIRKALDYSAKTTDEAEKYLKPLDIVMGRMNNQCFGLHVMLGKEREAVSQLNSYKHTLPKPWSRLLAFGYLQIALEKEDTTLIKTTIADAEKVLRIFGEDARYNILHNARGHLYEIDHDYINAIMEYQKESHYTPTDVTVLTRIARCYRYLGDYSKAKKFLENTLSILPMYAEAHFEIARVYAAENDLVNARKHMDIVQTIWKNADCEYPPAIEAKLFYNSINQLPI